jgi:isopentenyl-diphosphate delta-isomerase
MNASPELVVLVDEAGEAIGTAPKATVHHAETPLHLAFSCYLFDPDGRLLLTQRALHKPTWPGVWTNSFCGHPAPGEDMFDAVRRRASQELGLRLGHLQLTLPTFRYDATMADGTRENELCPVFTAVTASALRPDPAEVAATSWVGWAEFRDEVLAGRGAFSPWSVRQVADLAGRATAGGFEEAPVSDLPPAATAPARLSPGP